MGNENNFQTSNDSPKNNTNHKKRIHKNNSNLYNNFTDQENLLDFLIKVENGILLPNLNLSNSISLNNINVPSKNLKNEINYLQSINDFTDIRLERNKEFDFNNDINNKTKYIEIMIFTKQPYLLCQGNRQNTAAGESVFHERITRNIATATLQPCHKRL